MNQEFDIDGYDFMIYTTADGKVFNRDEIVQAVKEKRAVIFYNRFGYRISKFIIVYDSADEVKHLADEYIKKAMENKFVSKPDEFWWELAESVKDALDLSWGSEWQYDIWGKLLRVVNKNSEDDK